MIQAALRTEHLGQPTLVTAAYAATVRAQVAILTTLQAQARFRVSPGQSLYMHVHIR